MRKFLLIFLRLLIPVTILVSVLLTLFFTVDYSFSQALSLGVLYGLFSGIGLTIILSIALLLLREGRENVEKTSKKTQKQQEIKANEELIKIESSLNQKNSMDHKLMLLMNKELTFEIILIALKNQFSRSLTTQNIDTGSIDVTTHDGIISISVLPLTKHTSQVTINGLSNSKYIQNIVSFLKEKEHSFLQY